MTTLRCAICSAERRFLFLWRGFRLYRCTSCGTESVDPMPSAAELNGFYQGISAKKMVRSEQRQRRVARAMRHYLDRYRQLTGAAAPARFLDLGGGVGYYASAAEREGIQACLMDYAGDALRFARETLRVSWVVEGDIRDCARVFEPASFDLVLARHTIEHVLDPGVFLDGIARVLRDGGVLAIETPNVRSREQFCHLAVMFRSYRVIRDGNGALSAAGALRHAMRKSVSGVNPPKHLWGFTLEGLRLLLERSGFRIVDVHRAVAGHPVFDPLYYDLHRLSTRTGLGIPYYFWERAATPLFRGNGTNLAVLARRSAREVGE
jgi:SAM-dependent methyltransferase